MTTLGGDIDRQLAGLVQRAQGLAGQCRFRSAIAAAHEVRAEARRHGRLLAYLRSALIMLEAARATLEVELGLEVAVEALALLENVHKARQFQPDLAEEEHSRMARALTCPAYALLARLVGLRDGYNSDGFHEVIDEAIEFCRQHDRSDQIVRFRQFARDEFLAAGDLEMSLQQARSVLSGPAATGQADLRWPAAWHIAWILELNGQLSDAWGSAVEALRLAASHDNPLDARLQTWVLAEEVLWLAGEGGRFAARCTEEGPVCDPAAFPAPGEYPAIELSCAQRDAVAACCMGEPRRALQILGAWDERLRQLNAWTPWLEVRLRQIAAAWLAGDSAQGAALAGPLETQAHRGRQWQILGRLRALREGTVPAAPVAFLARATCGPFAMPIEERPVAGRRPPSAAATSAPKSEQGSADLRAAVPGQFAARSSQLAPPSARPDADRTSWADRVVQWKGRLRTAPEGPETLRGVVDELLSIRADQIGHADEAACLLDLADQAAPLAGRAADAWRWAEPLARQFPASADVLNLVADLGHAARMEAPESADRVAPVEQVERLFRRSLELDIERPRNFGRAGFFYRDIGRRSEAERCLARGFRLDRTDAAIALALAELYCDSDRLRDALAVLDISLREGAACPDVARHAGLLSLRLERYEASLRYWRRVEELAPGELWTHYYCAWAHLGLNQPGEALGALDEEERRFGWPALHLEILRACAASALGNLTDLRRHLRHACHIRLADVDYLSLEGLLQLFGKLYEASHRLPPEAPERAGLESLMLAAGLAPDRFFLDQRRKNPPRGGLGFYVFRLRQPLDQRWRTFEGCCAGQENWQAYVASWGVLASGVAEAEKTALDWQARCYALPAEVLDFTLQYEGCDDSPGVVWQGPREGIAGG